MIPLLKQDKSILIIEDEKPILEALQDRLRREGFSVIGASDGSKGLDTALIEHPDLILLDVMLPKMDGMMVLEKLRKDQWGLTVPVILLTNLDYPEEIIIKAAQWRVSDYLVKADLKLREVVMVIKERLEIY